MNVINAKPQAPAKSGSKDKRRTERDNAKPLDAIRLLKEDHREAKAWFKAYEKLESPDEKQNLADQICHGLSVHMQIEEEIFYPAIRPEIDDEKLMDEAEVEHGSAKQLIADIRSMKAGEPLFCAKVKVLGEYIDHHVEEEESEIFPEARDSKVDLKALGAEMADLKVSLMSKVKNRAAVTTAHG